MSVCSPSGYRAGGVAAGIKPGDALDCAAVLSDVPATGAGVFTTNRVKAAPVVVSERHLTDPACRAVVLSSGNANAATGPQGLRVAEDMCAAAAAVHGCETDEVLIAQTGLIGIPLDGRRAVEGVRRAVGSATDADAEIAARAIMTTDTRPKLAHATASIGATGVSVGGIAKGAAMLSPSMATMLAVLTTDAAVAAGPLRTALGAAMADSFHSIVVDDMSTNDCVLILANGASGAEPLDTVEHTAFGDFAEAVADVCKQLAMQMVHDAEGARKVLQMTVRGAATEADARRAAKAVCASTLVKCSLAGEDPYWGRVISELGACGADFDASAVRISYGPHEVCRDGAPADHDRGALEAYMKNVMLEIVADLGAGNASAHAYGTDLTHAYVDENMGTS